MWNLNMKNIKWWKIGKTKEKLYFIIKKENKINEKIRY